VVEKETKLVSRFENAESGTVVDDVHPNDSKKEGPMKEIWKLLILAVVG
jgi:hypothetical protein